MFDIILKGQIALLCYSIFRTLHQDEAKNVHSRKKCNINNFEIYQYVQNFCVHPEEQ